MKTIGTINNGNECENIVVPKWKTIRMMTKRE